MNDIVWYLVLGVFDALAIVALGFKYYRFPFWEYAKELVVIAVITSWISYLNRIVLQLPEIDMISQLLIVALLFRYLIKMRFMPSFIVAACGYLWFILIQYLTFTLLVSIGTVSFESSRDTIGLNVYMIQIVSQVACYLICWAGHTFNLGFASFHRPPHDLTTNESYKGLNLYFLIATILATLVIFSIIYWIFYFDTHPFIAIPLVILALTALTALSYRKEIDS